MPCKDYVLIAAQINARVANEKAKGNDYSEGMNVLYSLVSDLAIAFADDNPTFDMRRFFKACGFHTSEGTR